MLEVLEERTLVNRILAGAPGHGDVTLVVGDENDEESLKPFSIVLCQYGAPEESSGAVAVVGPPRMEYANRDRRNAPFSPTTWGDLIAHAR